MSAAAPQMYIPRWSGPRRASVCCMAQ